jgi:hydroxymethylpyrimidine pyrophosphatase-like HAD family hydrolase
MYVTRMSHWALLYCRRAAMGATPAGDLRRFHGSSPLKLLAVDQPEKIARLLPHYQERWGEQAYITVSMAEYLEFMNPTVSKGAALRWLADHFAVELSQTLAVGDQLNDLPLLETAGHAAAMPAGDPRLREFADFVPSQQHAGVAEALDWFLAKD